MKKITLLMTALLWSSLFYGQHLSEGFESGIPGTWVVETTSGSAWASSSVTANSGSNSAHNADATNPTASTSWLISESFDLTGSVNPELTYYEAVDFPDFPGTIEVYYVLNYPGSGTPTGTLIRSAFDFTSGEGTPNHVWKFRGAIDLSAISTETDVRIAFFYNGNNGSEWYIDDVLVRDQPTCQEPTSGNFSNITADSADFTFVPFPAQGETSWDVELVDVTGGESQGGGTTTSESSTTKSFTSLASSNSYDVYVRANCGGGDGDSAWAGPFSFTTLDSNDDCSGANSITQEIEIATAALATAHNGNVSGATDSGIAANCSGGTPDNDVWFSFVAQTDAVNINVDGSGDFDVVIEVFSTTDDTCGTLVYKDCADNNITPPDSPSEAYSGTGFEAGKTYFVRVYDWNNPSTPSNPNFTIKIWSSESLSEPELEKDVTEFRFYPNPVQDKLNLRAQDNIENISVYNMLGQEVMRQAPNKNSAEVNMSGLQTGSYFVKVTINGITETKQIIKR
ncbi:T9SS type A sorting domain-containing protein [Flavobacteriaceae sp. LMIT009]